MMSYVLLLDDKPSLIAGVGLSAGKLLVIVTQFYSHSMLEHILDFMKKITFILESTSSKLELTPITVEFFSWKTNYPNPLNCDSYDKLRSLVLFWLSAIEEYLGKNDNNFSNLKYQNAILTFLKVIVKYLVKFEFSVILVNKVITHHN